MTMTVREALRDCECPRPCNGERPDLTVGECVDKGQCGCQNGVALAAANAQQATAYLHRCRNSAADPQLSFEPALNPQWTSEPLYLAPRSPAVTVDMSAELMDAAAEIKRLRAQVESAAARSTDLGDLADRFVSIIQDGIAQGVGSKSIASMLINDLLLRRAVTLPSTNGQPK